MFKQNDKVSIFWCRRDLRLHDNNALSKSVNSGLKVQPVFILDTNIISELSPMDPRVNFIYDNIKKIHERLRQINSSLLVIRGTPLSAFAKLSSTFSIEKVYANKDYEPYAIEIEKRISS